MEYDFSSLKKIKIFDSKEASDIFMHFFELQKEYIFQKIVDFNQLKEILTHDIYFVMNNHPRYKGKKIFFTGNVVQTYKNDLLDFIGKFAKEYDLIIPLFIVPVIDDHNPYLIAATQDMMIMTQEDPIFTVMMRK